jgi:ABC-type branched-subunit amino acid transport system ATPase component/ABC-type branched-subunit amino acid transport system permease subunit
MSALTRPANVVGVVLVALLFIYPIIGGDTRYYESVLIVCMLYAIMASGWNIISGLAGYVSLGHSVYLYIGMYTGAILGKMWDIAPMYLMAVGGLVAAAIAAVVGFITLRTRSHSFVIITIAVLLLVMTIAQNWKGLTGGTDGFIVKQPGWNKDNPTTPYYYVFLALMVLTVLLVAFIMRSRLGAGLVAIRNDEGKAASIGINTTVYKVTAYTLSAVPFGFAGAVYAQYLGFVTPTTALAILMSVFLVLAALVGGRGTLWGPVIGGFIVWGANEASTVLAGEFSARLLIMGVILILTVMFMPAGLLPTISRFVHRRKSQGSAVAFIDQASIAQTHDVAVDSILARPGKSVDPAGPVLEVRGIVKRFGGVTAVDGVDMAVERGSITGLIGPNGSGKTTLFNCMTGTFAPDGGTVLLNGEDITRQKVWTRAHEGLGRTFQITRLFKSMTVLDNLVAPLEKTSVRELVAGRYSGEEVERAREVLDFMGLAQFETQEAAALSFGQQKLVELAQVLMLRPSIILLDEPASGINPTLIEKLAGVIRRLNEAGTTVLIVEHNIPLVLGLCDTVHVLAEGEILISGTPDQIRNDPQVIEAYLGPDHMLEVNDV